MKLKDIYETLKKLYTKHIGYEFYYIDSPE
jgi:2-oxoglutarate dehydrogenase complex dehydrogenase (E1) component-like enzyme